jgi:hypothetical protein
LPPRQDGEEEVLSCTRLVPNFLSRFLSVVAIVSSAPVTDPALAAEILTHLGLTPTRGAPT